MCPLKETSTIFVICVGSYEVAWGSLLGGASHSRSYVLVSRVRRGASQPDFPSGCNAGGALRPMPDVKESEVKHIREQP